MIIRPPEWLRWLIDFKLSTEEDIESYIPSLIEENIDIIEKIEKKSESDKIKDKIVKRIELILNRIHNEYTLYPFKDKYTTYTKNYDGYIAKCVDYVFENGDKADFIVLDENSQSGEFIFELTFTPHVGDYHSSKSFGKRLYMIAKDLLVKITNKSVQRNPTDSSLKTKYNLIVRKIKERQEELNKMNFTSPLRESLVNELNSYKRMATKLKEQIYKIEST